MWLDTVRLYTGSQETGDGLLPFVGEQVVGWGKAGQTRPLGLQEFCVDEIIPATIGRACD